MKEQFADYKTCQMARELGLDVKCYEHGNEGEFGFFLWQQVKQWLWGEHEIFIEIIDVSTTIEVDTTDEFQVTVKQGYDSIEYLDHISSPITAEIEGIKKAVEYLRNRKISFK